MNHREHRGRKGVPGRNRTGGDRQHPPRDLRVLCGLSVLLLHFLGCSSEPSPAAKGLDVKVRFASSCAQAQTGGAPPAGITSFTVTISGGALGAPMTAVIARGSDDYLTVDGIPAGSGYTVTVEGNGDADWKGTVAGLSFADGQKTEARVFLTRVGGFTCGPEMGAPRFLHAAAKTAGGRLLITGGARAVGDPGCSIHCCDNGCDGDALGSTDLYDPATGAITAGPAMKHARAGHTATALPDGRVVIIGGVPRVTITPGADRVQVANVAAGEPVATIEVYDPATNAFSEAGKLTAPRFLHGAAAISKDRVVVAGGGLNTLTTLAPSAIKNASATTIEVYDAGKRSTASVPMGIWRTAPAVMNLDGDRVLILGGTDPALLIAEIYDPAQAATARFSTFDTTVDGYLAEAAPFSAAPLPLGGKKVLTEIRRGGMFLDPASGGDAFLPVDLWDAASVDFGATPPRLAKVGGSATTLLYPAAAAGSELLVCGGATAFNFAATADCEVRDAKTGARKGAAIAMSAPRLFHTASVLDDGTVLFAGGADFSQLAKVLSRTEIYRMP